jgi:hypothetical protein
MSANGDHKNGSDRPSSSLEEVAERLSLVEEEAADDAYEPPPTAYEEDHVHGWKSEPPTLDGLKRGLIAVSQISEAAIEGGIKMASDLRKVVGPFQVTFDRVETLVTRTEVNARALDKTDRDVLSLAKDVHEVKKAVQGVQVDIHRIAENTNKIPAIMEMLGEIIARLPEPEPKAKPPLALVEGDGNTGTEE